MRRIFILILLFNVFLLSSNFPQENSFAEAQYIIINSSYSYIYKDTTRTEHYDLTIKNGEMALLLEEADSLYKISYKYDETEITGYIPSEIASIYKEDTIEIPVYNGKIIKTTEVLDINGLIIEDVTLESGHQIYLYEGFDSNKEYTKIKFCYQNQVFVGQVKTINLSPNGVNKAVIIAFSIITAIVGIIIILLGLKKNKWHKILKKKKK